MAGIDWDDKSFQEGVKRLLNAVPDVVKKAVNNVAEEVLRLSSFEVPHNKGLLSLSGQVEPDGNDAIVGYNKVYAARLHEHPEYRFQKGRKGKYLEDPIKNNNGALMQHIQDAWSKFLA